MLEQHYRRESSQASIRHLSSDAHWRLRVERSFDQMAVLIRDGQRGQQLDRMVAVASDLREQFVIIE